nr:PEGA domain-containing protein [Puniceicoccus vermicola]
MVESNPVGAKVTSSGKDIGTTPVNVEVSSMFSKTLDLLAEGYLNESLTVDASSAPEVRVELVRQMPLALNTDPEGALVFSEDGRVMGTTPYDFFHLEGELPLVLKMKGYMDEEIVVGPANSPELNVELVPVSPGNLFAVLSRNLSDGRLTISRVYSSPTIVESGGNADALVRVTEIMGYRVIDSFSLFPGGDGIALSLIDISNPFENPSASSSIWSAGVDGTGGLVRRTETGYFDLQPTYSPEGDFLFFASNRAGGSSIFRIASTGRGGSTLMTSQSGRDNFPDVEPSGERIFYSSYLRGLKEPQIWSQPLPNGPPSQLRTGFRPRVSPDGKSLLFTRYNTSTESNKIWKMRTDGSEVTELASTGASNDMYPSWSPDGGEIVFASDRGANLEKEPTRLDIWIMNADGSNVRQLTTNSSRDDQPVFSPDGDAIYFRSNRGLAWNIWRLSL